MSRSHCHIFLCVLSLLIASGAIYAADASSDSASNDPSRASGSNDSKPKPSYSERYGVLSDRNIFLKDRRKPASRGSFSSSRDSQPYTRPPLEASFVLTGIVLEEGQYRAYVEDVSNSKVMRLGIGDAVARGHITEIEIDAISYLAPGQQVWVNIGSDLRGQPFSSFASSTYRPTSPSTSTSATTGPASSEGGAAAAVDPNTLTTEQKMRLRAAQERGK
jgi:hypothetical protein